MTPDVTIRRALESDAATLLALRTAIFQETEYMLWESGEFRDTVDEERQRIARLNGKPNSLCLVATKEVQLIGFLNAMGGQVNRLKHSTTLALGVLSAHWGKGVATAMLNEALSWSRRTGITRVELTVHTTNHRAISLYERAGFQIEGTRRCSLLVSGRYVDEYLMSVINRV